MVRASWITVATVLKKSKISLDPLLLDMKVLGIIKWISIITYFRIKLLSFF